MCALREISGTYWLTWVSLAIVSRLTRIISSIDPTVANFQVNDPILCEIRRDENHNLPLSLLLNLRYLYHWEVSVRISTLTLCFHGNLSYFLFILHCYERIYIYTHHVGYVCSERISIVLVIYYKLLTLKLRGFDSDSNRRHFAFQSDALSITPCDPEALSDIFGYILAFLLISTLN